MRRLALRSALSSKVAANEVFALESLSFDTIKTKNFKEMLSNLSLEKKVLFVVTELEENTVLSGRNIPGVEFVETTGLNVLDILGSNKVVFTKDALGKSWGGISIMEARDIIKRPVLTEKSYLLMQENKYTFLVDTRAHKTQIKQAIEEIFGVKVEKVNVMNYKPKFPSCWKIRWLH